VGVELVDAWVELSFKLVVVSKAGTASKREEGVDSVDVEVELVAVEVE